MSPSAIRIRDVGDYLAGLLTPQQRAACLAHTPMKEDGLRFGDDAAEATGVLVCWMATAEAIALAAQKGCNAIVCHEDPFYQAFGAGVDLSAGWRANRERLRLLVEHGISVYRCHSPLDVLYTTDAAVDALGLEVRQMYAEWIARVATVAPITVAALAARAKAGFGVDAVRVAGEADRTVTRVGFSVGGMGLSFNGGFNEWLRRRGAEAVLTGEVDDYGAMWCAESGVTMLAVGHPVCEIPGLRRFFERLRADFPGLNAHFYANPYPCRVL